jgi:transposase
MAKGAGESAERIVKDIRRKTRRRFSAEEKIRIVPARVRRDPWIERASRGPGSPPAAAVGAPAP